MGCINQQRDIIITKASAGQMSLIMTIKRMIKDNPIHRIELSEFKLFVNNNINANEKIMRNRIESLLSHLNLSKVQKAILMDILTLASDNLAFIYPSKALFDSICYTMYFFLCKSTKKTIAARNQFIFYLLETAKEDSMIVTGKFTFLVYSIYKFLSYIMLYLFISPTMLEFYEEFTYDKLEIIYIQKVECNNITPDTFYSYIINKMKIINPSFSKEKTCEIALKYIFSPMVECKYI